MIYNEETADRTAAYLLRCGAVRLQPDNPFTWASGLKSPIYCDNRITLSFPEIRNYIKEQLAGACRAHFPGADLVAGVATAGIPQGTLLADLLGLPFVYIRSASKSHGMTNRIEGEVRPGQKAVVVEDLVSTGKSSLNAVSALRDASVEIAGMLSVFTYDLDVAKRNFEREQCKLVSLSSYDNLIKAALDQNYIRPEALAVLRQWRENPEAWSKKLTGG